jgi:predicted anti-sigma-YlaC factor YlaD
MAVPQSATSKGIPVIQRMVAILWPSFITAGIATIILTTLLDPQALFAEYDISRFGGYSICFLVFWVFGIFTAMSTCFFLMPCSVFNKCKTPKDTQSKERYEP